MIYIVQALVVEAKGVMASGYLGASGIAKVKAEISEGQATVSLESLSLKDADGVPIDLSTFVSPIIGKARTAKLDGNSYRESIKLSQANVDIAVDFDPSEDGKPKSLKATVSAKGRGLASLAFKSLAVKMEGKLSED
jgi:hypothetical protein